MKARIYKGKKFNDKEREPFSEDSSYESETEKEVAKLEGDKEPRELNVAESKVMETKKEGEDVEKNECVAIKGHPTRKKVQGRRASSPSEISLRSVNTLSRQ